MRKVRLFPLFATAALTTTGLLGVSPAMAQPRKVAVVERYCATARQELAAHPLSLRLDEVATPLAAGTSAIDNLRFSLSRIGDSAPAEIVPVYRDSVGTLGSLRVAWKTLKTSRNESRKSNARIFFANSSASFSSLTNALVGHVSTRCQSDASNAPQATVTLPTIPPPLTPAPSAPVPPPIPVTVTTPAPTPIAPATSGNATSWLAMINQARTQPHTCGGTSFAAAAPLVWDARLEEAARVQSGYQQQTGTMTHTGTGGSNAGQRMSAAGFAWSGWAENVGWNYPGAAEMMQGWMNSPGHCANIMQPELTHVGWARVGAYDTMVLGRLR